MRQNKEIHRKFLDFSLGTVKGYKQQILLTFLPFIGHCLLINFVLPILGINLLNSVVIFKKNIRILRKIGVLISIYLVSKIMVRTSEFFNKKYFGNLARDMKRDLIKFLINEEKDIGDASDRVDLLNRKSIAVFFRTLMQLIPNILAFVIIFIYFTLKSSAYLLSIGLYVLYVVLIKGKIYKVNSAMKDKKKYLVQNNGTDIYVKNNQFYGDENDFMDSFNNILFDEEENIVVEEEKTDSIIVENEKISLKERCLGILKNFYRNNREDVCFIVANMFLLFFINISSISVGGFLLFLFFTFQITVLFKLIVNTHILNVKDINDIKKILGFFRKRVGDNV